jgi:hypothetical protein
MDLAENQGGFAEMYPTCSISNWSLEPAMFPATTHCPKRVRQSSLEALWTSNISPAT